MLCLIYPINPGPHIRIGLFGCRLYYFLYAHIAIHSRSTFPSRHFIKYTDDSALVSLLHDGEEEHGPVLDHFLKWCERANFVFNTAKTKEMSVDFRRQLSYQPTFINGEPIQSVTGYKYLGVVLNHRLKWDFWIDCLCTKAQEIMYFLRKLLSFNVDSKMLHILLCFFWKCPDILYYLLVGNASGEKVYKKDSNDSQ